jgi:hypothetical protein
MKLDELFSNDFDLRYGFLDVAGPLRTALSRSGEIADIRFALARETLSEDQVRVFVEGLLRGLKVGHRLEHDTALCAIAVALETVPGRFADEFLDGLAAVRATELGRPARVARESIKERRGLAKNQGRRVILALPTTRWEHRISASAETG